MKTPKISAARLERAVARLRKFNKWRRGDDPTTFAELDISPKRIGKDIDIVCKACDDLYHD